MRLASSLFVAAVACSIKTSGAASARTRTVNTHAGAARGAQDCTWWYETTSYHGWSFRNVSDFGAVGDGVHDDTAAIQAAIDYNRGGDSGSGQDKSAALVYIPPGTYLISDTLVLWKWTKFTGNPICPPTLIVAANTPAFAGMDGLRPVIVTNVGFNISASEHAWWLEGADVGGNTNMLFFTQMSHLTLEIQAGNPGAVGITWNVAQQTSIRFVTVVASFDTAIGIDVGAGPDYEHWNNGTPYNLGGGGVIEDVTVVGGQVSMRVAVTQFLMRSITIRSATTIGLKIWQQAWSLILLDWDISDVPLAVAYSEGEGTVQMLDWNVSNIYGGRAVTTDGSKLLIQNFISDASVVWVVDGTLRGPAKVASWAQGPAYLNGTYQNVSYGALPLPTLEDAVTQNIPLVCNSNGLCGGSQEDPSTGIPYVPLPIFEDPEGVYNAHDAGAIGDGKTDDTVALQAAIVASRTVFIPFGMYLISDTLYLRSDSRLVGEGLTVFMLAPNSTGFGPVPPGGNLKPVLATPLNASASVQLADISLWNTGCGNEGAAMLLWASGPFSSMHDVNMLVGTQVGAKAVVFGTEPDQGTGYVSNSWWPATMNYQPDLIPSLQKSARPPQDDAWRDTVDANAAAAAVGGCLYTDLGVIAASGGPMFWVGVNFEHSVSQELAFFEGATNHIIAGFQTEEALIALTLNATRNTVIFGALTAFWNASQSSITQALANRPTPVASGFDLSYRIYGLGVPISSSEAALFVDAERYYIPVPGGGAFAAGVAILNPAAAAAAHENTTTTPLKQV